ncbi:hypothetical protein [Lactococcus formosensis]|uniref:hypothetical protein n=1 Tax=Lactococcus formosensis TaxID=1281486 RepID=UPI0024349EAB|nr:hypothetical protein [Lactococcus formosensis]MDG6125115.1 hypothetical protein [Lactococcus formosensis]MDG6148813.1 hypothetical protein [Lactococcus formosensis]
MTYTLRKHLNTLPLNDFVDIRFPGGAYFTIIAPLALRLFSEEVLESEITASEERENLVYIKLNEIDLIREEVNKRECNEKNKN